MTAVPGTLDASTRQVAAPAVLETRGVSKSFGPVEVLSDISMVLAPGQVHAVIGENGAGKSTLMRLLAGHLTPSRGSILLDGNAVTFRSPADAEHRGIVLVHQEILLAPDLTVAQNIFMGRELRRGLVLDDRAMNEQARAAVQRLGAVLSPRATVARLSIAQRQLVQIARALHGDHRIVIFDEPTASLTPHETDALLRVIDDLRMRGVAVLYISHRLPEVAAVSDQVTVLRDGKLVASRPTRDLTPLDMAHLMVGRDMAQLYPSAVSIPQSAPVLEVEALTVPGFASDVAFQLRRGEILGFAGLIGAGRTEAFEGLVGLRPAHAVVKLDGKPVRFAHVRDSLAAGLVYLSEDRKGKGLLLAKSLRINLTLAALRQFCVGLFIRVGQEKAALERAFVEFDIRAPSRDMLAGQLSGGNQQKLLLSKMMLCQPRIIIIDEPTRGIDIGTKEQIYRFVSRLAAGGKAVVVISSEMQELIGLCHRILVMREGRLAGELHGSAMTEQNIVILATGADTHSPDAAARA